MKKKNKIKFQTTSSSDFNTSTLIKIVIGVLIVLVATYFLAALLDGDIKIGKDKKEELTKETSFDYNQILASDIYRKDGEYFVLVYDYDTKSSDALVTYKETYSLMDNALKVYKVDIKSGFNKEVLENENISETTLIKVGNHNQKEKITGNDQVIEYLSNLIK